MIPDVISIETKTASGTITIPTGCTLIYAVQKGSETAVSINAVDMTVVASTPAVGQVPALSVWKMKAAVNDEISFLMYGSTVTFVYLAHALDDRGGAIDGYDATGTLSGALATSVLDLVLGVVVGLNSPVTLVGDGVAFTYLINELTYKIGYIVPGDSSLSCVADDPDTTSGYWQEQAPIYHGSVLVSAAWVENLPAVHHNGYWDLRMVNGYEQWVWVPPWDEYPQVYHPAVYSDAWTEYPPPVYIDTGVSGKVNAIFCSVLKKNTNKKMRRWL